MSLQYPRISLNFCFLKNNVFVVLIELCSTTTSYFI